MAFYAKFCDRFLGKCISEIPNQQNQIFLSFDDGPEPGKTDAVLKLLNELSIPATFFVISEKAKKNPELIKQILEQGHAIGNHSLDHRYKIFFKSKSELRNWIETSQKQLTELCGSIPVGFRSPAGVRTPKLHAALRDLNIPLIHWSHRFFDTVKPLNAEKIIPKLKNLRSGSVLLFHDVNHAKATDIFIKELSSVLLGIKKQGFSFAKIPGLLP